MKLTNIEIAMPCIYRIRSKGHFTEMLKGRVYLQAEPKYKSYCAKHCGATRTHIRARYRNSLGL